MRIGAPMSLGVTPKISEHMQSQDAAATKAHIKRLEKELRGLFKASLQDYKSHTGYVGHTQLVFVQGVQKLALSQVKRNRRKIEKTAKAEYPDWKSLSNEEKTVKRAHIRTHSHESGGQVFNTVNITGLEEHASKIMTMWTETPTPNVPHHPTTTAHRHADVPTARSDGSYKLNEVIHWCRQAISMLVSIATRKDSDQMLTDNVTRARELRETLYHNRVHLRNLKKGHIYPRIEE